ncbi:FAD-dependent oxidoreductase [Citricoccus sp. NPDC079358]|jgi:pyruvate/2-oxoglutarate dehydrogenase complex dihydrolipoamide dehydrogenase (E3) component|uniref:FAD-dependent oxidoreductase n=1 Tax=Citricoccus sp. NPDC079358 TaxID=3154653 RepID=UPI00344ED9CD
MEATTQHPHREHVDLLVIGWGKGGKTLAGAVGRSGRRVALVEQDAEMVGGTCINVACVPTKALVHDAGARRPEDDPASWFSQAVQRRDTLTAALRAKNHSMLDTVDSVLLVSGHAVFTGPREVTVDQGGDTLVLTADTVVINTGSVPTIPAIPGLEDLDNLGDAVQRGGALHDSTTLQHVDPLPRRLVVVGGGYVGLEFASMFAHFGSEVTVLDRGARPLKHEDEEVAGTAVAILEEDGVSFRSGASVTAIDPGPSGPADEREAAGATVTFEVDGEEQTVGADAVLLALGRTPATAGLGLDVAGVVTDEQGFVQVDEYLRTSAEGVFAIGDVTGGQMFTYTSLDDYRIVADQLSGSCQRSLDDRVAVPYTMFLTPPLARVGMSLTEAKTWAAQNGRHLSVASKKVADIAAMPRPKIEGDPRGLISVVVDTASDLLLGASLQHVHAEEVINLVALAMRHGVTATELRDSIYTHPSATEALNEVLGGLEPLD